VPFPDNLMVLGIVPARVPVNSRDPVTVMLGGVRSSDLAGFNNQMRVLWPTGPSTGTYVAGTVQGPALNGVAPENGLVNYTMVPALNAVTTTAQSTITASYMAWVDGCVHTDSHLD
jgi:hypothetical protein